MTLKTALVVSGDSSDAKAALAELEAAIGKGETQAQKLAAAYLATDQSIGKLAKTQAEAKQEVDLARAAYKAGEIDLEDYNRQLLETKTALGLVEAEHRRNVTELHRAEQAYGSAGETMRRVTRTAGEQRIGMQQLGYQLGDVAQQYALGVPPMRIFAQQGGQVVQASQLMLGGTGRLATFLSGPWGVALTVGAVAIIPLIEKMFEAKDAAEDMSSSLRKAVDDLLASLKSTSALGSILDDAAKTRIGALGEIARLNREIARTEAVIRAGDGRGLASQSYANLRLANLKEQRAEQQKLADAADAEARRAIQGVSDARAAAEFHRNFVGEEKQDTPSGGSASAGAIRARTDALSEEERARENATKATEAYISSLEEEIAKIGLDAKGLRQLEVTRQLEAAQTDDQRKRISDLNQERERGLAIEERRARAASIGEQNKDLAGSVAQLEREAQVLSLVGWLRERVLLRLEREAEIRPLLIQLAEAEAAGQSDISAALRTQIDLLDKKYGIQIQAGDEGERLDAEADAARETARAYDELGRLGAGALSDIALHGQNASDVMKRLTLSIADAALEAALLGTGPLASLSGGEGTGGLVGSLIGAVFGGPRADGGPVAPGKFYTVNERSTAPGIFFPIAPGRIDPASNDNGGTGRSVAVVQLVLSDDIDARIQSVSGPLSVEIARSEVRSTLKTYDRGVGPSVQNFVKRRG